MDAPHLLVHLETIMQAHMDGPNDFVPQEKPLKVQCPITKRAGRDIIHICPQLFHAMYRLDDIEQGNNANMNRMSAMGLPM